MYIYRSSCLRLYYLNAHGVSHRDGRTRKPFYDDYLTQTLWLSAGLAAPQEFCSSTVLLMCSEFFRIPESFIVRGLIASRPDDLRFDF